MNTTLARILGIPRTMGTKLPSSRGGAPPAARARWPSRAGEGDEPQPLIRTIVDRAEPPGVAIGPLRHPGRGERDARLGDVRPPSDMLLREVLDQHLEVF